MFGKDKKAILFTHLIVKVRKYEDQEPYFSLYSTPAIADGDKAREIVEKLEEETKILFKVVDKLEKRISTLEKVLASHAKCIGEIRKERNE